MQLETLDLVIMYRCMHTVDNTIRRHYFVGRCYALAVDINFFLDILFNDILLPTAPRCCSQQVII